MTKCQLILLLFAGCCSLALSIRSHNDEDNDDDHHHHQQQQQHHSPVDDHDDADEDGDEDKELKPDEVEKLEYHKGSICGYCDYCKFCKLCDLDCPCETIPSKPNCHMCKYCKYCYLCKVCDTVCQPGGIIDRISASIFNALPRYNKEEIDKDIDGVQMWINKKKEEL